MNPIELLEREEKNCCYYVKYPFVFTRYYVSYYCSKVVQHWLFDIIIILVIISNCIILATDDPTTDIQETWQENADYTFQAIYTVELVVKVLAMGFIFNENAYMRDLWNIFDFIIVVFGYLQYLNVNSGGFDLRPLRIFRVLRPLRTVTTIEGLRILMNALAASIPMLLNALIILIFFLTIFAIAGLQLWHGLLRFRCMEIDTGIFIEDRVCGSRACPEGYSCEDFGESPNYDVTKFDNFLHSLLLVFTAVTLEGWTIVQGNVIDAYGYTATIYFNLLTYIGTYFLFNFTLAVINNKVSSEYEQNRKKLANKKIETAPKGTLKKKVASKGSGFRHSAIKSFFSFSSLLDIDLGGTTLRMDIQTTVVGQYKEIMGIDEMEEDDLIIETKKPKQKKKKKKKEEAKKPTSSFPDWYKKKFLGSLELKQETKKPKELEYDLDEFTSDFFGQIDSNFTFK